MSHTVTPTCLTPIPETLRRACAVCKVEKDLAAFKKIKGGRWRTHKCLDCFHAGEKVYRESNRERIAVQQVKHRKRVTAMRKAFRSWRDRIPEEIDAARRALSEHPPELTGDGEMLAYFRGFMAASKRGAEENERLASYQDLIFRIAAEEEKRWRSVTHKLSYEDMISLGYEAVLHQLRLKRDVSRGVMAHQIRLRFADEARERFGRAGFGTRGKLDVLGSSGETDDPDRVGILQTVPAASEEPSDLMAEVRSRLAWLGEDLDERIPWIVEERVKGRFLHEIASDLGVDESRVHQILKEAQPLLEKHILPLAAGA